jgi:hypothetical protein
VIYSSNVASTKSIGDLKALMLRARLDVANHAISTDDAIWRMIR